MMKCFIASVGVANPHSCTLTHTGEVMAQVGIISAGSWGTAVGSQLGNAGHAVCMWTREQFVADDINQTHENKRYLSGYTLSSNVTATTDLDVATKDKELIILATPSLYLVQTVEKLLETEAFKNATSTTDEQKPIIGILSKGFLESPDGQPLFITQMLEKMLPPSLSNRIVYISGPSHAEEVVSGKLTGLIGASTNPIASIRTREILRSRTLLVYSSLDIIGVQTCAAAKNIIAIAFGMLSAMTETSGLFGDNSEALLLAAGLNEMQTLGKALGATHSETFTSIAGVGDLEVTCRSRFGRNRKFGIEIVKNNILEKFSGIDDIIKNSERLGYLAEGVPACKYVHQLAVEKNVKLQISDAVFRILNKEITVKEFIVKILTGDTN